MLTMIPRLRADGSLTRPMDRRYVMAEYARGMRWAVVAVQSHVVQEQGY